MKKLLLAGFLLVASMVCQETIAQNYQPFRKGLTYHFISQDSVYSMRIDSVKMVGGDSVFVFNQTVKPVNYQGNSGCGTNFTVLAKIRANNQFGSKVQKKNNGNYVFTASNNQEFLLKTKAPIGQSWQFTSNPSISATITSKSFESFSTVSDSVITYALTNGNIIKLSKNYGLILSPNFVSLADATFSPKTLAFHALPEKQVGEEISNILKIFDFQPGDEFGYYATANNPAMNCFDLWTFIEVLARNPLPNGVSYIINVSYYKIGYGSNNSPDPTCRGAGIGYVTKYTNLVVNYTTNSHPEIALLTNGFYVSGAPKPNQIYNAGSFSTGIFRDTTYNQRYELAIANYQYCSNINGFIGGRDYSERIWYAVGLGKVKETGYLTFYDCTETLIYYKRGTETLGNRSTFTQILGINEELKDRLFSIFPNPFTNELSLKFSDTFKGGNATVSIANVLGQEVYKQQITAAPNQEVKLSFPEMAKGVYVLRVTENKKTYTTRLVKE